MWSTIQYRKGNQKKASTLTVAKTHIGCCTRNSGTILPVPEDTHNQQ